MSDLAEILRGAKVETAAIVDDAYETVPNARDLSGDTEQWSQFFEDVSESDAAIIREDFPKYDDFRADELRRNNDFVGALWKSKNKLRPELIGPLFERYTRDSEQDLTYLSTLGKKLASYGLRCSTATKVLDQNVESADLIVVDLYLGSTQDEEAIANSVNGLKELILRRAAKPPLVVLMSRSSRLEEKRKQFRDESGLFESAFRIIRKTELADEGKLSRVLIRLAEHYVDSTRLAAFLNAWQVGLTSARDRTGYLIRTLDLADLAQIGQLLLADEDEGPGSYLVDVFDLVLQHEIEREAPIIDAAIELNHLNTAAYPPPYVSGSPDLQALVYRCVFQNNQRLRLTKESGSLAVFGDILRRKPAGKSPQKLERNNERFADIGFSDVLAVLTPACDLQRRTMKRILLLKGSLIPLTSANWLYDGVSARTAVFETAPDERFQIKWDLKHVEAISCAELDSVLKAADGFEVVARLRDSHALELQQKLLSSLGRIGVVAPMPGTFPVKVEAYLPGTDKRLFAIDVPALNNNPGVCFVGRRDDDPAMTLVLCEDACEGLCEKIESVDLDTVHATTSETIKELRSTGELLILQKGIDISGLGLGKFTEISCERKSNGDQATQKVVIALARKAGDWLVEPLKNNLLKQAGVVLVVSDEQGVTEAASGLAKVLLDTAPDSGDPPTGAGNACAAT